MKNSCERGKRGEREWRDELRAQGWGAYRGQQYSGSPNSPDVVCDALPWIHFEVKYVERLDLPAAMNQARRDCGPKVPMVAHRRNFRSWLVTMKITRFYYCLQRDLTGEWAMDKTKNSVPAEACREVRWLHCRVMEKHRFDSHDEMEQARREAGERFYAVAHRDREGRWLATVTAETFFKFLRGELPSGFNQKQKSK